MTFNPKNAIKQLIHCAFVLGQGVGVDILPRHFYSEIPNIRRLRHSSEWRHKYSMRSVIGADCDEQLHFLRDIPVPPAPQPSAVYDRACEDNGAPGYGLIEAELLYAYIVFSRPAAILQIGAGVSTSVILQAAKASGYRPAITCIDPYPTEFLRRSAAQGLINLVEQPVQTIAPDRVQELAAGDLLFIDSTHTLGPAGEVSRLVLEWLPCLTVGVRVHFHDITFPYDYPGNIISSGLFFSHETPLLHAFLAMNPSFRILCSLSMLHHERRAQLAAKFPDYRPCQTEQGLALGPGDFPTALFLERIA